MYFSQKIPVNVENVYVRGFKLKTLNFYFREQYFFNFELLNLPHV